MNKFILILTLRFQNFHMIFLSFLKGKGFTPFWCHIHFLMQKEQLFTTKNIPSNKWLQCDYNNTAIFIVSHGSN
jgi:hypothetical protein